MTRNFSFVLQKRSRDKALFARLQFKLSVYGAYPQNLHGYRSTMLSSRPMPLHVYGQSHRTAIARTPGRAVLKGRSALQENAIQRGGNDGQRQGEENCIPVVSAYHSP
jgi:hypothetical protein